MFRTQLEKDFSSTMAVKAVDFSKLSRAEIINLVKDLEGMKHFNDASELRLGRAENKAQTNTMPPCYGVATTDHAMIEEQSTVAYSAVEELPKLPTNRKCSAVATEHYDHDVCRSPFLRDSPVGSVDLWLEDVLSSMTQGSGEVCDGVRSRHCWFSSIEARVCCDAHNAFDMSMAKDPSFIRMKRMLVAKDGPCPGRCVECNPLSLQAGSEEKHTDFDDDEKIDGEYETSMWSRVYSKIVTNLSRAARTAAAAGSATKARISGLHGNAIRSVLSDFFNTIVAMVREKAEGLLSWVIPVSLVTICVCMLINYKDEAFAMIDSLISLASNILSAMGVSVATNMAKVWSILRGFFRPVRKLFASTGSDSEGKAEHDDDIVLQAQASNPFAILTAFAMLMTTSSGVSAKSVMSAMQSAYRVVPVVSSLGQVAVWATTYLPKALADYAVVFFGFVTPADFSKEARACLARANDLRARYDVDKEEAYEDPEFVASVLRTHAALVKMMSIELMAYSAESHKRVYYREAMASLAGLVHAAKERTRAETIRLEPLGVWIAGPPGVGKTTIIRSLVAAVHTTAHEYDLIYTKNLSEKFWSGYQGQKAVLVDDFGVHDSEVAKSFNGNILTYMSSAAGAILDMPFEKGTKFTSESLWLTGNGDFDKPVPGIKVSSAFLRRFPVQVTMELKNKYKDEKGQLNMTAYSNMTRDQALRQDHCLFKRRIIRKRGITTEVLNYTQLALLLKAELLKKRTIYDLMVARTALRNDLKAKGKMDHKEREHKKKDKVTLQAGLEFKGLDRAQIQKVWADVKKRHNFPADGPSQRQGSFIRSFFRKNTSVQVSGHSTESVLEYLEGPMCTCYSEENDEDCAVCHGPDDVEPVEITVEWLAKEPLEMNDVMEHAEELVRTEAVKPMATVSESLRKWRTSLAAHFMDRKVFGVKFKSIIAACLSVGAVVAVASVFYKPKSLLMQDKDDHDLMDALAPDVDTIIFGDDCGFTALQGRYDGAKQRIQSFRKARAAREMPKQRVQHASLEAGAYIPEHRVNEVKIIERNLVRLSIGGSSVHVLMLSGTVGVTMGHIFRMVDQTGIISRPTGELMEVHAGGKTYDVEFDPSRLAQFRTGPGGLFSEVCSYDFGHAMPSYRDITQYFVTEEQIQNRRSLKMSLLRLQTSGNSYLTRAGNTTACSDRVAIPSAIGCKSIHANTTEVLHRWDYDILTQAGDCGSLGVSAENATNAIVCMHFAYNNSSRRGMGVTLSKDLMQTHLSAHATNITLEAGSVEYFENVVYERSKPGPLHRRVKAVGFIDDPHLPGGNGKSRLTPSVFRAHMGQFKCEYGPAALGPTEARPADTVDKLVARDMCRITEPEMRVEQKFLRAAVDDVVQEIIDNGSHGPARLLSKREVLNGGGDFPFVKGMVMSTSAGYDPRLADSVRGTKKSAYFRQDEHGEYSFDSALADGLFDSDSAALMKGELPMYIWSVSLKDELRSAAKNAAGLTRNINCSPLMTTCMTRRFFGSFINSFMSLDPTTSFSAVGLNVYSPNYNDFVQDKLRIGSHGFDGDLTKFESTFTAQVLEAIRESLERKFFRNGDGGRMARIALFKDLTHTYFRVGSKLYRKQAWNPSGTVLTTAINTIWTATLMRIAWMKIMMARKPRLASLSYFHRLVADASFGDDNRSNVAPEVSHLFNRKAVAGALAPYGIVMTGASKGEDDGSTLVFHTELEFLKGTTAVGVLNNPACKYTFDTLEESLQKSLLYVSNKQDYATANIVNAVNMLRRAFTKGSKHFHDKRNFVLSILQSELGFSDHLITHDECERQFWRHTLFDEDDLAMCLEEDFAYRCTFGKEIVLQSGKNLGVTFTDPATIETNYTRPPITGDAKVDDTIVEAQLDMRDLVSRPQFLASVDWTTSQPTGAIIQQFVLPRDLLSSRIMADPFKRFKYWRGTVNLVMRLQCTAFHAGMIRVFFQPLDSEVAPSRVSASICQGFNMVAGSTQVGTLRIPFVHPQSFMETTNPVVPLGIVYVMVFNNLRVGTVDSQAHQCTLSSYAHLEDAEFKVLDPTTDNTTSDIILQGGLMSKVTNNNISLAAGATYVSHGDSDNFEGKTSNKVSGLDKPNVGLEAPAVRRRYAPDLATAANVGYKAVLGLYADDCDLLEPVDVGTKLDEMGFDYLFGKESLTDTVTMSRVTAPGTVLAQYQITPCRKIAAEFPGQEFEPDLLEFAAMPFEMWRGDIIMVVEMLGSSVNTARVAVCTHFGETVAPDSLQSAMGQYAHVFDTTAETNRFEVVLPYTSRFEWMRILHGTVPSDRSITDYSTGLVTLRAVSRLTYTQAVTDEIDINIYFKAGDNFEVKWLGTGLSDIQAPSSELNIVLQAGDLVGAPTNDQSDEVVTQVVAAPAGSEVAQATENRGKYRSVNDLMQRSTKSIANPTDVFDISVTALLNENPFFAYFSQIYKIWKGGVTVVFASRGDTALTFVPDAVTPGINLTPSVGTGIVGARNSQRGVPLVNCAGRNVSLFTFLVNYVSPMKFMMVENDTILPESYVNYGRVFGVTTNPDSTASCGLYVAASDELRFSYLYRVPRLRIASDGNYYPHTPTGSFIAPSVVTFVPAVEDGTDLKQEDIGTFIRNGTFTATDNTTFTVSTDGWTNEMFEDYAGVIIPVGANVVKVGSVERGWRSGITTLAVSGTLSIQKGDVGTIYQYDVKAAPASGVGTPYVDKRGVTGVGAVSFEARFQDNLGGEADFAALAGETSATPIDLIWPTTAVVNVVVPTGPGQVFEGTTFFEWDFKNSLAFI